MTHISTTKCLLDQILSATRKKAWISRKCVEGKKASIEAGVDIKNLRVQDKHPDRATKLT